ncbi:MAG: type III-B CRISPR module-associated Cmr3 family protein [Limisphaerales bacterium]
MPAILLRPNDVLFFRDGRPMDGASSGHGAAWPLPHVISAALHAALHRAFISRNEGGETSPAGVGRSHAPARGTGRNRIYGDQNGPLRHFTDFWSAGPYPVSSGRWFFPRPADAQAADSAQPTLLPFAPGDGARWQGSSLPCPLSYPVADTAPPSKQKPKAWFSRTAWDAYLGTGRVVTTAADFAADDEFSDTEHSIGIEIEDSTQTTGSGDAEGRFYSAHYLRLREGAHGDIRLGLLAGDAGGDGTIAGLFPGNRGCIIVGGQQRVCGVEVRPSSEALPLPAGITDPQLLRRDSSSGAYWVKWVLLSPALWPEIPEGNDAQSRTLPAHQGGWLPNWIHPGTGVVQLCVPALRAAGQSRRLWREGRRSSLVGQLVAALVPKPLVLTGWSLGDQAGAAGKADDLMRPRGAKSTQLAVPAGAVYYFKVDAAQGDDPAAHVRRFLAAMNWHGPEVGLRIRNRRSSLLGEKGFGLGVCGTWEPLATPPPHVASPPSA